MITSGSIVVDVSTSTPTLIYNASDGVETNLQVQVSPLPGASGSFPYTIVGDSNISYNSSTQAINGYPIATQAGDLPGLSLTNYSGALYVLLGGVSGGQTSLQISFIASDNR